MTIFTWKKEASGLFDYETDQLDKKILNTTNTTSIIKYENDIKFEPHLYSETMLSKNVQLLSKLIFDDGILSE